MPEDEKGKAAFRKWLASRLEPLLANSLAVFMQGCEVKVTIDIKPLKVVDEKPVVKKK